MIMLFKCRLETSLCPNLNVFNSCLFYFSVGATTETHSNWLYHFTLILLYVHVLWYHCHDYCIVLYTITLIDMYRSDTWSGAWEYLAMS